MTDKKTFGSFIKVKRAEKNYSQKDLADIGNQSNIGI